MRSQTVNNEKRAKDRRALDLGWFTSSSKRPAAERQRHRSTSVLEEGGVFLHKGFLVFRYIIEGMNRIGGAHRDAGATVNATFRIDIHLGCGLESRLVLLGVNAISGADIDAE
jgi:hypothetical protein